MGQQKKKIPFGRLALLLVIGPALADLAAFSALPFGVLYPVIFDGGGGKPETAAILFNDFNGDFTGVNDETKRRIHHGLSLLETGRVKQVVAVGGNRERSERKGARLMVDYMLEQGTPPEKILVEASSKDSMSNLEQLGKVLAGQDISTLGLVSSPYHLLRIRTMDIPLPAEIVLFSYDPADCFPQLTRKEAWFSAHYNAVAYLAQLLLPEKLYRNIVYWVREHTEW